MKNNSNILIPNATSQKKGNLIPTVTVVVSAYNEEHNVLAFLRSVLKQKEEGFILSKIIIVSDGSTDRTVQKVRSLGSKKIIIREYKKRLGKSLRLNHLYRNLKTDYLIQSDADVIFGTDTVVRDMVAVLQKNTRIGLIGGNPLPMASKTFIEQGINSTVLAYLRLRHLVRKGNNPFSADGRLLGLSRTFVKTISIPHDMIANDRYVYYACKVAGWEYAFVPSAIVYFRSPQTIKDHIRQNIRFLAAPIRLRKYFPEQIIQQEETIPWYLKVYVFLEQWVQHPISLPSVMVLNRYCEFRAKKKEHQLNALWDMAISTKILKVKKAQL